MSVSSEDTMPIPPVTVSLVEPRVGDGNERFRALTGALHSEWIKLTSLRSSLAMVLIVGIAGLIVSWAVASFSGGDVSSVEAAWFYWTPVVAVLAAVAGVQMFAADQQHGAMSAMLVVQPSRRGGLSGSPFSGGNEPFVTRITSPPSAPARSGP